MAKHKSLAKGTRAELPFDLPAATGEEVGLGCLLRPLNGIEEEEALVEARARAIAKGVTDPSPGDPIYDLALMIETIALGCMDPDSPKEAREPTFADGDEIRASFGREAIAYIYAAHQAWQDEASPTLAKLDAKGYVDAIAKLGGPDEVESRRFFLRLQPGLLWSFTRSLAVQQWNSLWGSSDSGNNSDLISPTAKSAVAS